MILVTGSTGHVGRRVAELLAARNLPLRLMVRDATRAPKILGAQVVIGDYADPAGLERAFEGVDTAFVVSGYNEPGVRARLHDNAFRAAARSGRPHVVYLSTEGASRTSCFPMARDHAESEHFLKASGVPFTVLRDNLYFDLLPEMFDDRGVVRGPAADGSAAWVGREDVSAVVAAVLTDPAPHAGTIYDVTGPQALSLDEVATRLSALVGWPLTYVPETPEAARTWRSALGAPQWEIDTWVGSYEAIAAGEFSPQSDTVRRLTGRSPQSLESYFRTRPELLERLRPAGVDRSEPLV